MCKAAFASFPRVPSIISTCAGIVSNPLGGRSCRLSHAPSPTALQNLRENDNMHWVKNNPITSHSESSNMAHIVIHGLWHVPTHRAGNQSTLFNGEFPTNTIKRFDSIRPIELIMRCLKQPVLTVFTFRVCMLIFILRCS